MTTEFFIDDVRIKNPLNINGFYLTRQLSTRFNGMVYDQLGRVENAGNVAFDDPQAAEMIRQMKIEKLTEAKSTFSVKRNGIGVFSTNIDFSSIRDMWNGSVEASFVDYDANLFIRNVDTPYRIELPFVFQTASDTIYTGYSMGFDPDKLVIEVSGTGANRELNPIPSKASSAALSGELIEITDYERRAFYQNSTGKKIRLNTSISIIGNVEVSGSTTFKVKAVIKDPNGAPVFIHDIYSLSMSAGSRDFAAIEDLSFDIPTGGTASIFFETTSNLSKIKIVVNDSSVVNLSEGDLSNIETPGVNLSDAIRKLGFLASGGLLSFEVDESLDSYFLTSYSAIRGRDAAINISFGQLWDDINAMKCLKMSKSGDKMIIEKYAESFEGISPFKIYDVSDYSIDTDFEGLYNSVRAGFEHWRPDNDGGVTERTAPVTLSTSLPSAPSDLNLTCSTIAASRKMISEAFLLRDRQSSETDNEDSDKIVFIIPNNSADQIDSADSLNNWARIIGNYHKELKKTAGEGKYMDTDLNVNLSGFPAIFAPDKVIFSCRMDTEDFKSVGDFVQIIDKKREITLYVQEMRHYPFAIDSPDEGNTAITGRVINY